MPYTRLNCGIKIWTREFAYMVVPCPLKSISHNVNLPQIQLKRLDWKDSLITFTMLFVYLEENTLLENQKLLIHKSQNPRNNSILSMRGDPNVVQIEHRALQALNRFLKVEGVLETLRTNLLANILVLPPRVCEPYVHPRYFHPSSKCYPHVLSLLTAFPSHEISRVLWCELHTEAFDTKPPHRMKSKMSKDLSWRSGDLEKCLSESATSHHHHTATHPFGKFFGRSNSSPRFWKCL